MSKKSFEEVMGYDSGILPDDLKEREVFLSNNSYLIDKIGYSKAFTNKEIELKRFELEKYSIFLSEKEQEKKEFNTMWKSEVDPIKEYKEAIVSELKSKSIYVKEKCYGFTNSENTIMYFFNLDGTLVYQRPTLPGERNRNMFQMNFDNVTGTDE